MINNNPIAKVDTAKTNEDTAVIIKPLVNDTDADKDKLSILEATATNGTVVINKDGTLKYTPNANYYGVDTISYKISDGKGGEATSSVSVTVNSINDKPILTKDSVSTDEDTPLVISPLLNDTDADGDTLSITKAIAKNGVVIVNSDGTISYTPKANFNGVDTITYTVSDGKGGIVSSTITVTVNSINDNPIAKDDVAKVDEDKSVVVKVLANDTDADKDKLSISEATATNGTVIINKDGTIKYTPNKDYNGVDTISYKVSDGKGGEATASVAVTVKSINDKPILTKDSVSTDEDTPLVISPLLNDSDADGDKLSITKVVATNGAVLVNKDGTLSYTPKANFNGVDTITYTVSDGKGGIVSSTITVTVNSINDNPIAKDDVAKVDEDKSVVVKVLANDTDADKDKLSISEATATNGTVIINKDGTIKYTPNKDYNGVDTISYKVSDGKGGEATASVAVTVKSINDKPILTKDSVSTDEDTPLVISPLLNDSDADGDKLSITKVVATNGAVLVNKDGTLSYTPKANFNGVDTITYTVSDGKGGVVSSTITVTVNSINDNPIAKDDVAKVDEDKSVVVKVLANDTDADKDKLSISEATATNGTVIINKDGTIKYTPNKDYNGVDTISYKVSDGKGGTDTATVSVTVKAVNDAPVLTKDTIYTNKNATVTISPLLNDTDVDGDTLSITKATAKNGIVKINKDGTLNYTPNANFTETDTITYTVSDGKGGTSISTINIIETSMRTGIATFDSGYDDYARSIILNTVGNLYIGGKSNNDFSIIKLTNDGLIDKSFGNGDGIVTFDNGYNDEGRSLTLDSNGKIYLAGESNNDFIITRYHSNGMLDDTFGNNGVTTFDSGGYDYTRGITIDNNGNIYIGGYTKSIDGNENFAITKFTNNGVLDKNFGGGDGIATFDSGGYDYGRSIVLDNAGNIYLAGESYNNFSISKFTSEGLLDKSFGGGDGVATWDNQGDDMGYSLVLDKNNNLYLAGNTNDGFTITKFTSNGMIDKSFGDGDGVASWDSGTNQWATKLVLDKNNNLYIGGYTYLENDNHDKNFTIVKFTNNGILDKSFGGGDGVALSNPLSNDWANDLVIDKYGSLYIAGDSHNDFMITRFTSNGILDTNFGDTVSILAPIALDMNGNDDIDYGSLYLDVNFDGVMDKTAWTSDGDGILVWDKYRDGVLHDNSQFAFARDGLTDLEGLALMFDTNKDSFLNMQDELFDEFAVVIYGQMISLDDANISCLSLTSNDIHSNPSVGVTEYGRSVAMLNNGDEIIISDVTFAYQSVL